MTNKEIYKKINQLKEDHKKYKRAENLARAQAAFAEQEVEYLKKLLLFGTKNEIEKDSSAV